MNKVGINAISNICTKLWSTVSIYIFVPLYIKILGESAYGLVSFFSTLQIAMNLFGLGLSNTLRREFAIGESRNVDNGTRKYKLLKSVELIYISIGLFISFICIFGSSFISHHWLNVESLDMSEVTIVISLMGISIALQMIANLYAGCLFGLDLQVRANFYCIGWSVLKSMGALVLIGIWNPNLVIFYGWHIITDVAYLILLRASIMRRLYFDHDDKWRITDFTNIKSSWKYTLGILTISFVALVNKQLDKLIISKFLTLTEFGAYNVATTLGGLTTILPSAVCISVFSRFTRMASQGDNEALVREFCQINKLTNIFLSCVGSFIACFAVPLIWIWTGSEQYAEVLTWVGPLVVMAVMFIEYQEIPYSFALAKGNTKINVFVGTSFIPIVAAATFWGIKYFGLVGAGVVYFMMMFVQTVLYEFLVYREYINVKPASIILRDIFLPLTMALILAIISKTFVTSRNQSYYIQAAWAVICGLLSFILLSVLLAREELKMIFILKGEYKNDTFS